MNKSCNSAKSECSALDIHFLPLDEERCLKSPEFLKVVILDLGLDSLNSSSNRQC